MNTGEEQSSDAIAKPKRKGWRRTLLFLLSTCWVVYGWIPIVPIGAIVVVAISRPKKVRLYLLALTAAAIGFVGTGLHVTLSKVKRVNLDTGAEFYEHKFNAGIRFGLGTIDWFIHRGKVVIYDDHSCQPEVDQANAYVADFIENYNLDDANFLLDSFLYQQGITP